MPATIPFGKFGASEINPSLESASIRGLKGRVLPNGTVFFRDGFTTPSPSNYFPTVHSSFTAQPNKKRSTRSAFISARPTTVTGFVNPHMHRQLELGNVAAKKGVVPAPFLGTQDKMSPKKFQFPIKRPNTAAFGGTTKYHGKQRATQAIAPNTYNVRSHGSSAAPSRVTGGYMSGPLPDLMAKHTTAICEGHIPHTHNTQVAPTTYNNDALIQKNPVTRSRRFSRSERFSVIETPTNVVF